MKAIPKAPASLSPASKRLWRSVLTELEPGSRVPLDVVVLRRVLEYLDRAEHLDRVLASYGAPTVIDRGVPRRRPEALLARQAHDAFMAGWRQLLDKWHAERRLRSLEGRPSEEEAVEHAQLLELVRPVNRRMP